MSRLAAGTAHSFCEALTLERCSQSADVLIFIGMKVLIVSEVYRPGVGGVQTALDTLITGLKAAGDEVTVLTGSPDGLFSHFTEVDEINGAKVLRLPAVKWIANRDNNRVAFLPKRFVRRYFRQNQPDIIHLMTPISWLHKAVVQQASRRQIPIVTTNHTMVLNLVMNAKNKTIARWFVRVVEGKMCKLVNQTAYMTAPTRAALATTPAIHIPTKAVSNGVNAVFYTPGKADEKLLQRFAIDALRPVVAYVGRLDGEKRIDLLIAAMERLKTDAQLVIIGKGLIEKQLRSQAASLGDRCIFTGFVSDEEKRALLRRADILAMASPAELQCIAALEALACGTPVVVSDQVALPELLDGGKNGVSFHYPDVNDLARKIDELLNDEPRRRQMGRAARQWIIDNHTYERTVDQYRELYAEIVKTYL